MIVIVHVFFWFYFLLYLLDFFGSYLSQSGRLSEMGFVLTLVTKQACKLYEFYAY